MALLSEELFSNSLVWLKSNHQKYKFFVERDIVWTMQSYLLKQVNDNNLPLVIQNDYPMLHGKNRSLSTDLAIIFRDKVELAVEFKYEPSHKRKDIIPGKFPVVFWGKDGVLKDIERIKRFVDEKKSKVAISILFDEGGFFRKRPAYARSKWIDWENGTSILYSIVNRSFDE